MNLWEKLAEEKDNLVELVKLGVVMEGLRSNFVAQPFFRGVLPCANIV